jgi:cytochrome c-type biogenesis protein
MTFFLIAVLAGVLTVLAPCILPLLPVVVGASEPGARRISRRAVVVITTLAFSVVLFTLLLKASTVFITIPPYVWTWFSGSVLGLLGVTLLVPSLWGKIPFVAALARSGNKAVGKGYLKNGTAGDMLMGFALGPVFSTCSPTYLYIIATVLPASFFVGLVYLLGFVFGLTVSLLLIAFFGQQLINRISSHLTTASRVKQGLGLLLIVLGISIVFGWDKQLETKILDSGYGATIQFEESLINQFTNPASPSADVSVKPESIPASLYNAFPSTDWAKYDERSKMALSGGLLKTAFPRLMIQRLYQ